MRTQTIEEMKKALYALEKARLRNQYPHEDGWRAPRNIADSMACVGYAQILLNNYESMLNSLSETALVSLYNKTTESTGQTCAPDKQAVKRSFHCSFGGIAGLDITEQSGGTFTYRYQKYTGQDGWIKKDYECSNALADALQIAKNSISKIEQLDKGEYKEWERATTLFHLPLR